MHSKSIALIAGFLLLLTPTAASALTRHSANADAVHLEQRFWGKQLYGEYVTDDGCRRIERHAFRCDFSLSGESAGGHVHASFLLEVVVNQERRGVEVWHRRAP